MKSLMETLMTEEISRNCCRRTKHQLSALLYPSTDKTPAQGVHGCDHEGFMVPRPMFPGRFAPPHRQCGRDGQNTSSGGSWL
jgi:hypothetical protein